MEFFKVKKFEKNTESGLGLSKNGKLQVPYTRYFDLGKIFRDFYRNKTGVDLNSYNCYGQYKAGLGDFICLNPYKGYITKSSLFVVIQVYPIVRLRNVGGFSFNYESSVLNNSFKMNTEQFDEAVRLLR